MDEPEAKRGHAPPRWGSELTARDLGTIERRVPLSLASSSDAIGGEGAELCLTETGVWVVSGRTGSAELTGERLGAGGYTLHPIRADTLQASGASFEVRARHKRAARELVAVGRIRHAFGPLRAADFAGRYTSATSPLEQAVLGAWLEPGEVLLGSLPVQPLPAGVREAAASGLLALSERRLSLLAIGALGAWTEQPLEPGLLELGRSRGRRRVRRGEVSFRPAAASAHFEELSPACALLGEERMLEVCRVGHLHATPAERPALERLLEQLEDRGSAAGHMARVLLRLEAGERGADASVLTSLDATALGWLTRLWVGFQLSEPSAAGLIEALSQLGIAAPETLALARALRQRRSDSATSEAAFLEADLAFARAARRLGANDAGVAVLEERGRALASVPMGGNQGIGPERRIELYELLFEAAPEASAQRRHAALELTQLEPMSGESFRRLAGAAAGPVAARARECLAVLGSAAFERAEPPESAAPEQRSDRQLDAALVESRLQHPLVRGGAPLSLFIQSTIASSRRPNTDTLREYCERIAGSDSAASRALELATTLFGVAGVEAYVSRGVRDIGVRAFEAEPPFILVGGKHLDPGSPHHLSYRELCFALGAEVLQLRLGHARVSSNDVWRGALDKSRQGVELLLGVLPLLSGWNLAGQAMQHGASRVQSPFLRRVWGATSALQSPLTQSLLGKLRRRPALRADLTLANEELVVAQRLMQLSADRAGLLLADSLQAAVRAILLTRADYATLLQPPPEPSLLSALERRARLGSTAFTDLSVRIGALTAFYVSEDYAALRMAL